MTKWEPTVPIDQTLDDKGKLQQIETVSPQQNKHLTDFFEKQKAPEINESIDVLLFGDTNCGKTYLSMDFPEPIFFIDTEKRANKTVKYHYPGKDVRVFDPVVIKKNFVSEEDAIDYSASIDNITNVMIMLNQKLESGEIKEGTLVIDSMTDVWRWIWQYWAVKVLAKKMNKDGTAKADSDLSTIKSQFDWKVPNSKNERLMTLLRNVTTYGMNFVGTARQEGEKPDYVTAGQPASKKEAVPTDKIRGQKDLAFLFSSIINLKIRRVKSADGFSKQFLADILKIDTLDYRGGLIENINYEKIKNQINELAKQTVGGKQKTEESK